MSKTNWIIAGLLLIIFVLGAILVFRKPSAAVEPFDETPLREEIARQDSIANHWQNVASKWEQTAQRAINRGDSLEQLKPSVKHFYHEIYTFNNTASTSQLDSVIRANW